jgi:DNA-binding NarL/FixJ family response regulator
MRVIVVGTERERRSLRAGLAALPDIVGEFESVAAAREAGVAADALLLTAPESDMESDGLVEALTPREVEVLELVAQGLANKAVASRLAISDQTVKYHLASISGKLGAINRTDAVRRALRRGLMTL